MSNWRLAIVLVMVAGVVAGCRLPTEALDGPLAVPLRITPTPTSIDVDAPGWFASDTALWVCSSEPPALPEPGPGRDGWTPGGACHDYGHVAATDGLRVVLDVADLTATERSRFGAARDWYLLLVKFDGNHATSAIHSSFSAPALPAT